MTLASSTPTYEEFDPRPIPYQARVIHDIYNEYNYSLGAHEVMLSGSVGSAKSILMAHLVIRHCIENMGARVLLGRKALPDLKGTIYQKIMEHLYGSFVEGEDFTATDNNANIKFRNGSEIISRSWSDKRYKKVRSLDISMAVIEELTENNDEDKEAYDEIKMRVGRLPHVKTPLIISATNPDAPSHWAYKYFIESDATTRHVYYSVTTDNPFLPPQYIEQLRKDLDPKLAQRMIYGRWIEIKGEVVYHQYDSSLQFIKDREYIINPKEPIYLCWDFNIGEGKPMSACAFQYNRGLDEFHVFDEVIIEGARTADTIDEWDGKGLLSKNYHYAICGDASGASRDTRGARSDYDIITKELSNRDLKFAYCVPPANPPVRSRHNRVNAYCLNDLGRRRLFVYKNAPTVNEGLKLTKLKKGAGYIEDDSKRYQHVTTALGYGIMFVSTQANRPEQRTLEL